MQEKPNNFELDYRNQKIPMDKEYDERIKSGRNWNKYMFTWCKWEKLINVGLAQKKMVDLKYLFPNLEKKLILSYLPTPPLGQDMIHGQRLSGV